MLHVRLSCPADLTAGLAARLAATPGVTSLVVLPGAARDPAGDAVQFDVAASAANSVLRDLRARQPAPGAPPAPDDPATLDDPAAPDEPAAPDDPAALEDPATRPGGVGPIAVQSIDAVLGPAPDRPRRGSYHGDTEPAWDLVEARITSDSVYAPSFYALLVLAALIGAVGILTNSTLLIVGAMVTGPEYSAIIAVALGLERRDRAAVRRGLAALAAGFLLAIVITLLFGLFIRWTGDVPEAYRRGIRPVSQLINNPDLFSVIVAVLAGLVGVVSLTEARASALIGVFISVTTIPAAADLGLSLAFQTWPDASGSAAQLLLNVVLLIAVGAAALRGQRRFWRARTRARARAAP